jgi:cytochrome c oxidase cbb3-type subunit 3
MPRTLEMAGASLLIVLAGLIGTAHAMEGDHTYSSRAIATGYNVYMQNCALCHGIEGNWIEGIDLSRSQFRTVVTDHDLMEVVRRGAGDGRMPSFDLTDEQIDGLIAYIRIGFDPEGTPVRIGDAAQGQALFNGKGACNSCHRVRGVGPRTAPDLTDIGLLRMPAVLQRTLVDPQAAVMPINRPVTIVTQDDETISGRRLNEDTYTVQLIDSRERLLSLEKADLKLYEVSKTPTHQPTSLSSEEVADLVAYLMSLRGES